MSRDVVYNNELILNGKCSGKITVLDNDGETREEVYQGHYFESIIVLSPKRRKSELSFLQEFNKLKESVDDLHSEMARKQEIIVDDFRKVCADEITKGKRTFTYFGLPFITDEWIFADTSKINTLVNLHLYQCNSSLKTNIEISVFDGGFVENIKKLFARFKNRK